MMDWVEFVAKNVSDAVTEASIKFEVTSDLLEYEVLETEKSGVFGLFSRPAKIRARKKEVEPVKKEEEKKPQLVKQSARKAESRPLEEKPLKKEERKEEETARKQIDGAAVEATAQKFLADVLAAMDIKANLDISYNGQENLLKIDMEGEDMGILIGKRGQTLDSLQYLVSLVINKESASYVKVKLDTEDYRARRKETLENLAKNISYKVKRTKHPVSLEPMNPYERRIIHSALQGDKFVETHSEGEEPYRRVVVTLKKNYKDYNNKGTGKNYNRSHSGRKNYERKNVAGREEINSSEVPTEE